MGRLAGFAQRLTSMGDGQAEPRFLTSNAERPGVLMDVEDNILRVALNADMI